MYMQLFVVSITKEGAKAFTNYTVKMVHVNRTPYCICK